ncbi:MAG: Flp family type IVb pilin [Armatimonadetes bacterium]|nr:Flp family type IVb pilin [Armatimonadota bacterium]
MINPIRRLWHDEDGNTSVEYALLLVVIVVGCLPAWTALRNSLVSALEDVEQAMGQSTG